MQNRLNKYQKYSGGAGILVLWSSVIVGMFRARLGLIDARPISYLGVDLASKVLFSIGLIVSSVLFIWFAFYVRDTFRIKNRFLLYFLVGQAGQIIAALAPYGQYSRTRLIHTYAASVLAFSLPLLIKQFASSQAKSEHKKLFRSLLQFERACFVVGIGIFVLTKGLAPLGEALPAIGFHVWIIAVTLVAVRTRLLKL